MGVFFSIVFDPCHSFPVWYYYFIGVCWNGATAFTRLLEMFLSRLGAAYVAKLVYTNYITNICPLRPLRCIYTLSNLSNYERDVISAKLYGIMHTMITPGCLIQIRMFVIQIISARIRPSRYNSSERRLLSSRTNHVYHIYRRAH
jgi:hypothetical protein